jgi:hypothetical protein
MNGSSQLLVLSHEASGDSWACPVIHEADIAFVMGNVSDAKDLSYFTSHKPELVVVEAAGRDDGRSQKRHGGYYP